MLVRRYLLRLEGALRRIQALSQEKQVGAENKELSRGQLDARYTCCGALLGYTICAFIVTSKSNPAYPTSIVAVQSAARRKNMCSALVYRVIVLNSWLELLVSAITPCDCASEGLCLESPVWTAMFFPRTFNMSPLI